jgi:cytoskeleton protein RodZ
MQDPLMQEPLSGSTILSRVASDLKAARLQRGLSLDDASRILLIQKSHIEKLEAGNFTFFPGAYVFAYIKEYLREMGLGDEAVLDACRKELSVSTGLKRYAAPEGVAREAVQTAGASKLQAFLEFIFSRRKAMALVAGALLAVAVFAMVMRFLPSEEATLSSVPEAPSALLPDSFRAPSAATESVRPPAPAVSTSLPGPVANAAAPSSAKPTAPRSPAPSAATESVRPAVPAVAASLPGPVVNAAVPSSAKMTAPHSPAPADASEKSRTEEPFTPTAPAR